MRIRTADEQPDATQTQTRSSSHHAGWSFVMRPLQQSMMVQEQGRSGSYGQEKPGPCVVLLQETITFSLQPEVKPGLVPAEPLCQAHRAPNRSDPLERVIIRTTPEVHLDTLMSIQLQNHPNPNPELWSRRLELLILDQNIMFTPEPPHDLLVNGSDRTCSHFRT